MDELWVSVPGFDGYYEVSDAGRVRSTSRTLVTRAGVEKRKVGRVLSPSLLSVGYLVVALCDGERRETTYVHRIVAAAFCDRPSDDTEVCHRDGNPLNNAASNLYWGTRSENLRDSVRHGTHAMARKTHCKQGHEFTPENTAVTKVGNRRCRACHRASYHRSKSAAQILAQLRATGQADDARWLTETLRRHS